MTIQDIQFQLMEEASFNGFNGKQVVRDLKAHPELWQGVVMDRAGYGGCISLIKLRDISENYWNVDTVYILAKKGKENELYDLAETWNADEIDWIPDKEAQRALGSWGPSKEKQLLRVWWD